MNMYHSKINYKRRRYNPKPILIYLLIMIFLFWVMWFFAGCNDSGKIDPGIPVDTVKNSKGEDSVIYIDTAKSIINTSQLMALLNVEGKNLLPMKEGDNYEYIQGLIDQAEDRATLYFPKGDYQFSQRLHWKNKAIWLIGSNGTRFFFKNGGVLIDRDAWAYDSMIKDIAFISTGEKQGSANGIEAHSITHLVNVWVQGFAGNGIHYTADVATEKNNVIGSMIVNCQVYECGKSGYFFHGGDASSITVFNCAANDNGEYGFFDDSFLGNTFIVCRAHASKLGNYRADNGNNRTLFYAPYSEQDSPPSVFGGFTRLVAGLNGWEVKINPDGSYYFPEAPNQKYVSGGYLVKDNAQVLTH